MSLVLRDTPSRTSARTDRAAHRQPLADRVREACESFILTSAAGLVVYAARRAARLAGGSANPLAGRAAATAERLFAAVHDSADCAFIADRDGVVEHMNNAFADMMGFSTAAIRGNARRMFPSHVDREFYSDAWRTLRAGQVHRGVIIDRKPDGAPIHVHQTITPLKDRRGKIVRFIGIARDVTREVESANTLRRLNTSLEQQARRIAQALHDDAGQLVTAAHILVDEIAREVPTAVADRLNAIKNQLDSIESEVRRLAHELRPRILDDLGLVAAVEYLSAGVERRRGIAVSLAASVSGRLPPLVETTVYRVIQEALNNAGKHGRAQRIAIAVERHPQRLRCSIADDGVGFDAAEFSAPTVERGFGLEAIREQIEVIGGTLQIDSAAGRGTRIAIAIPLDI